MSRGLGKRQREVLAKLAEHRENPPDYNAGYIRRAALAWAEGRLDDAERLERMARIFHDHYPDWMTINELVDKRPNLRGQPIRHSSDVASTYRAVWKLEAAGLVETRMIRRSSRGQRQLGIRLTG